ncbi:S66 peptidase family protein [Oceanobacillus manasiensis]|uniref:S66 peptidase family protein n=1 Tax=Oceanobacillus manasiensis TaxID=586413 RepID=UPI000A4CB378|nr:LD-carboxypeptidase [Oceanobacillus manasiensis]
MICPEKLQKGDHVGIIAPAGPIDNEKIQVAVPFFEKLGLQPILGKYIQQKNGYLAGTDQQRLEDLHDMFADPSIKAIICARGGYGTGRIAANLDYELIKQNPKIFWGYSDITYLHTAIRQKTDLVTFHGPMVVSDIARNEFDSLSASRFSQLFKSDTYTYTEEISPLHVISPGEAEGEIVGGNLSLLVSTLGTPYEIDTKDKILFIEDIGEEPYKVDGMLNHLRVAGKLEEVAGIVVGDFANATPTLDSSFTLQEVLDDYFHALGKPVLSGFKIGHCFPHVAVPFGVTAKLSSNKKTLKIEPGVR